MIKIKDFIHDFPIAGYADKLPWSLVKILPQIISEMITRLDDNFSVHEGNAIHKSAIIEQGVVLKSTNHYSCK
jgi:hypothetical protein